MGLWQRLFGGTETRDTRPSSWDLLAGAMHGDAPLVNARTAENLSTVLACVSAIASGIASLPVWVYRRTPEGRELAEEHPLMALVRQGPNQHQSWPDFVEWLVASTLLRGNGLAEIIADQRGAVRELRPIAWEWASVQMLLTGRLVYDVAELTAIHGGTGRPRRLLQDDVLHIRDRSDDGVLGRSRLQRAAAVVAAGMAIQDFSGAMFRNGVNPSGVLEAEGKIPEEKLKLLAHHFREAFSGTKNASKAMILDQGLKWKSVSVSPEDAELLGSRRFSGEELCRIFQVPPPIIGDLTHGTFTNSETAGRWFAMHTLTPWVRKLEAVMARSLLTEVERDVLSIEFDLSGLLRGSPEQRWLSHQYAVVNGILTPNEIREVEGWNPRPDGDALRQAPAAGPGNFA